IAISDVRRAAVERKQGGELIEVTVERHPNGAYTTTEMVALERDNIGLMRAGLGGAGPMTAAEEVAGWAEVRGLSEEQTAALTLTLAGDDWVVGIEGRPGPPRPPRSARCGSSPRGAATGSRVLVRLLAACANSKRPESPRAPSPRCLKIALLPIWRHARSGSLTNRVCSPRARSTGFCIKRGNGASKGSSLSA